MTTLFPGSSKKEDILDWAFDGRMDKIREGINDGYDSDDIHSCIMVISKTCELDDLKFLIEKLIADTPERKRLFG